jgi:hypothetical protein
MCSIPHISLCEYRDLVNFIAASFPAPGQARRNKSEYTRSMDVRDHLKPKQVNLLVQRVQKRISVLEGVRLTNMRLP